MKTSILTKSQVKKFAKENLTVGGEKWRRIEVEISYDDDCNNGHNTFAIIGAAWSVGNHKRNDPDMCGCIHELIAEAFPEFKHLIKWHLTSSDGPMYYLENTIYHAKENDVLKAWFYLVDPENKINQCLTYTDINSEESKKLIATYGDKIVCKPDEKTAKNADLAAARHSAIWPDATLEQLRDKDHLLARLPDLMSKFRADIESIGFVY